MATTPNRYLQQSYQTRTDKGLPVYQSTSASNPQYRGSGALVEGVHYGPSLVTKTLQDAIAIRKISNEYIRDQIVTQYTPACYFLHQSNKEFDDVLNNINYSF